MKIGVGKLGKSIKFDRKKWVGAGGDCDGPMLIELLAKLNPDVTFHLIGKSDYRLLSDDQKVEYFPNNNVFDTIGKKDYIDSAEASLKENLDGVIILTGPTGSTNLPNFSKDAKKKYYLKVLDIFKNYVAPIVKFLNEYDGKTIWLCVDPRYVPKARDIFVDKYPKEILSQYNEKFTYKAYKNQDAAENYKSTKVKYSTVYSGIETLFLCGKKKFDINNLDEAFKEKKNVLRIVLNQGLGSGGDDRYPILMKYIGKWGSDKCIKNVEIYGKWNDDIMEKDPRFKGIKTFDELSELMRTCKATLIIPIKKGWVTSKYVECMNGWDPSGNSLGCITFFGGSYDKQGHVIPKDHFLRTSPMEFKKKLAKVLTDDDFCKQLYKEQYKILKDEYYTGEFLNELIMNKLKEQ